MINQERILISVTVCSYNRIDTITRALDSVLAQKGNFDLEVLLGDDGSTDGSREMLVEYQKLHPQVKLVYHEKNLGLGGNWAMLAKQAKGKYLASCDDDDYWHNEHKLQAQLDFLEANHDYGVVFTDYRTLDVRNNRIKEVQVTNSKGAESLTEAIFSGHYPILVSSTLIRKELVDKYVPHEDYVKYRFTVQDWPTWIILSKYTQFKHLSISTVTYSIGVESITTPKSYESVLKRFSFEKVMYKYLCDMHSDVLFYDEKGYDMYVVEVLMKLAYKKLDYKACKGYASELRKNGKEDLKIKCASNPIMFFTLAILYKLKAKLV